MLETPRVRARVAIDHARGVTLDEGHDWPTWDAALGQMGVPPRLLGDGWPEPLRVLARERATRDGMDRWTLARLGVVVGTIAAFLGWFALILALLPWAEPVDPGDVVQGEYDMFGGTSWRGGVVVLLVLLGIPGILGAAREVMLQVGPRDGSSEKTRTAARAARSLRALDFIGHFDGLTILNDPSGAWLAAVERNAMFMWVHLDEAEGNEASKARLRSALHDLLPSIRPARDHRRASIEALVDSLVEREDIVFLPLEFDVTLVERAESAAADVERYRRWLPPFPLAPTEHAGVATPKEERVGAGPSAIGLSERWSPNGSTSTRVRGDIPGA